MSHPNFFSFISDDFSHHISFNLTIPKVQRSLTIQNQQRPSPRPPLHNHHNNHNITFHTMGWTYLDVQPPQATQDGPLSLPLPLFLSLGVRRFELGVRQHTLFPKAIPPRQYDTMRAWRRVSQINYLFLERFYTFLFFYSLFYFFAPIYFLFLWDCSLKSPPPPPFYFSLFLFHLLSLFLLFLLFSFFPRSGRTLQPFSFLFSFILSKKCLPSAGPLVPRRVWGTQDRTLGPLQGELLQHFIPNNFGFWVSGIRMQR